MGKVYKDKKSKGCALCKPHKHGWAPKKKAKFIATEKEMDGEISKVTSSPANHMQERDEHVCSR